MIQEARRADGDPLGGLRRETRSGTCSLFRAKGAITYNDDIQGTAAVTVAGIWPAEVTKRALGEQRVLFFGAGRANIGPRSCQSGVWWRRARRGGCSVNVFSDSKGLVVDGRPAEYKYRTIRSRSRPSRGRRSRPARRRRSNR